MLHEDEHADTTEYTFMVKWEGHDIELSFSAFERLRSLKLRLAELTEIPPEAQKLLGLPLAPDTKLLADMNLKRVTKLRLVGTPESLRVRLNEEKRKAEEEAERLHDEQLARALLRQERQQQQLQQQQHQHDDFDLTRSEEAMIMNGGHSRSPDEGASHSRTSGGANRYLNQDQLYELLDAMQVDADFVAGFESVYGDVHPLFHTGAVKNAFSLAKSRGQPLLLYLHNEAAEDTVAFCCGTLNTSGVASMLDENFVVWVGSVRESLDSSLQAHLGITTFPFFAVLGDTGDATMSLLELIQGIMTADHFIAALFQVLERHMPTITAAHAQRQGRQADGSLQSLREEQNREFEEALEADRVREAQQHLEQLRLEQERAESLARQEAEAAAEQQRVSEQQRQRESLPDEPPASFSAEPVATICVRMPNGSRLERRFLASHTVGVLYRFVAAHSTDAQWADYKLATSFPKRDLLDHAQTLEAAGLVPDALLILVPSK